MTLTPTNSHSPYGPAGGDFLGTYPNPTLDPRFKQTYIPAGSSETVPRTLILGATLLPAAGLVYASRITLQAKAYTAVQVESNASPVSCANSFVALYDSSATPQLLQSSADLSATLNGLSAAKQVVSLPLAYTVTTAGDYYLGFLVGSAGTLPTLARSGFVNNLGVWSLDGAPAIRSTASGLTAAPASITPAANVTIFQIWARMT